MKIHEISGLSTLEHIALMHQFQCTKCLKTCKTQQHSSSKEENKSPGTLSSTARAVRDRFHGKAATPATVAQARQLFCATEPPFTRRNTMFRANPITFKSHPWRNSSNAICQEYLQNTIQSQVTTPLLCCSTSTSTLLFSSLLYSTSTLPLTGGNDLCASENVTSWSLDACAHWTQWSLG